MAEEQTTPIKAATASSATQPGRKRRQEVEREEALRETGGGKRVTKRQELEREEALRETGGGIARYFIRCQAPIKDPDHDESVANAFHDASREPEEAPSPAASSFPGPTQMWALASPANSPLSSMASPSRSPSAALPALAHTSPPAVCRTAALVELPVQSPLDFSEVQVGPELQDEPQKQEQAPPILDGSLRPRSPETPGSQGSFPGPTQMWGVGIAEAEFGSDLLAAPALSTEAGSPTAQPPRRRRSISPTLSFHLPSPCRVQAPEAAVVSAPGELAILRPGRRSLSPTLSFHPRDGIAVGNNRRRSLSPTLSFHPPSTDSRLIGVGNAAGGTTVMDNSADGSGRPLKKQRSLSPTLSFHMPSPQRSRQRLPQASDSREVVPAGPT